MQVHASVTKQTALYLIELVLEIRIGLVERRMTPGGTWILWLQLRWVAMSSWTIVSTECLHRIVTKLLAGMLAVLRL